MPENRKIYLNSALAAILGTLVLVAWIPITRILVTRILIALILITRIFIALILITRILIARATGGLAGFGLGVGGAYLDSGYVNHGGGQRGHVGGRAGEVGGFGDDRSLALGDGVVLDADALEDGVVAVEEESDHAGHGDPVDPAGDEPDPEAPEADGQHRGDEELDLEPRHRVELLDEVDQIQDEQEQRQGQGHHGRVPERFHELFVEMGRHQPQDQNQDF